MTDFCLTKYRFDPRTMICLTMIYAIVIVSFSNLSTLTYLFGFALSLGLLFQIDFISTLKKVLVLDGFMLLALFSLPFTVSTGQSISLWGGIEFYYDGLWLAFKIALKANAIFLCFTALMGRMSAAEFSHALAHLKVPSVFVQILLLMIRYIDVLRDEFERLRTAMKCRGFKISSSWHCWKSLGHLLGMLFVRSFERGEQILVAMKCRGFQGTYPLLHHFHSTTRDSIFAFCFLTALSLLIIANQFNFAKLLSFINLASFK